jgi:predicted branched-subunit amino acid permease
MWLWTEYFAGARASIPFAIGAAVFGVTLGLAASQAGLNAVEMGFMSATVFAGASQLVTVGMIEQAAPATAIVAAVFAVNARHILMSATLAPILKNQNPVLRVWALLWTVDESWALTMARTKHMETGVAYLLGLGSVLYGVWMISTVSGVHLGDLVVSPETFGLDFLGVAVFLGLLVLLQPTRHHVAPFAIAAVLSPLLGSVLPGSWSIIIAACVGAAFAAWRA